MATGSIRYDLVPLRYPALIPPLNVRRIVKIQETIAKMEQYMLLY